MPMPPPTNVSIPVVETERLVLRGHRLDDYEACAAMWGDPEVVRHIGGRPFGPSECWMRLMRYVGHWSLLGYGLWAVEEKATGRFVGEVGFFDYRREIDPPLEAPEMGWVLAPWSHGRGYASEAVRAARAWALGYFGPIETVCIINPDNAPSLRIAEKFGFRETARTTLGADPVILFSSALG